MLTQDDYQLYTGSSTALDQSDFEAMVAIAEMRLASFLCLDKFPDLTDDNKDLAMLLANFVANVLKFRGTGDGVSSKRVRNFTINFKSAEAVNAFEQIATQYPDIVAKYSQCGRGVVVEHSGRCCCGRF